MFWFNPSAGQIPKNPYTNGPRIVCHAAYDPVKNVSLFECMCEVQTALYMQLNLHGAKSPIGSDLLRVEGL